MAESAGRRRGYIPIAELGVCSREAAVERWGEAEIVTGNDGILLVDARYLDPLADLDDDDMEPEL